MMSEMLLSTINPMFLYKGLTKVNGYQKLLLFGIYMSEDKKAKLLRITLYVVSSVYMLMLCQCICQCFFNLNLRAREGLSNMLFLQNLLLDFSYKDEDLVKQS